MADQETCYPGSSSRRSKKVPNISSGWVFQIVLGYQNTSDDYLFPVCSNQKVNKYLKEIMLQLKIKKTITFHSARHTFATTVTLSNGVPIETVSKLLGHTKLSTTQIYARVLENKLSEDMIQLKKKLIV